MMPPSTIKVAPPTVSVVIPVYNSSRTIPILVPRLNTVLMQAASQFEIILINDGSKDGSWNEIVKCCGYLHSVRGINLSRHYGQHNALLCGIRAAAFDVIITVDDDLMFQPEDIPRLLGKLDLDKDVVYGTPDTVPQGWRRRLAEKVNGTALRLAMNSDHASKASMFRLFRTRLRDAFVDYQSPFVSLDVLLSWATTRFTHVAVTPNVRTTTAPQVPLGKLLVDALTLATSFNPLLLRLVSLKGFAVTGFGLVLFACALAGLIFSGHGLAGIALLAGVVVTALGMQLVATGIVGEYIARVHLRSMGKPSYLIREEAERLAQ